MSAVGRIGGAGSQWWHMAKLKHQILKSLNKLIG